MRLDITPAGTSTSSGITFTNVTGTSQSMAVNSGYIANNAALVTLTLPATAAVGDIIYVNGAGAGGWKVAQNASQYIRLYSVTSTTGTGGYIQSSYLSDQVVLQCIVTNNGWQAWSDSNLDVT